MANSSAPQPTGFQRREARTRGGGRVAPARPPLFILIGRDHVVLSAGFVLLAVLIAVAPLAQGKETPGHELGIPPVVWEVVGISGPDGNRVAVSDAERYSVQFQPDGKLAVASGCIQPAGTYTAGDGTLEVKLSISTMSPCSTAATAQEESFLEVLDDITRYKFDHDGFLVLASDDESLWLRARLTGVLWEWQEFRGGDDSRVEPQHPENYTITFLPAGNLAIQAGCNRAIGTYSTDGATIELLVGPATGVSCPRQPKSDQFLRDLGEVTSHVFQDGNLYLALWADAGIMEFAARYPKSPPATPQAG
ncbi:MAG: META domain-containing protein [Chloroflexi bacterium]|nr:META domain-containing protein [Chloroflexota bacterium]